MSVTTIPSLFPKHLLSVHDIGRTDMENLFSKADFLDSHSPSEIQDILRDKIMAVMFFQRSTRTRLSFESAMLRLGGRVIGFADIKPCNAPEGKIPVSAPNKRLCVALTMLHDLMALTNVESHGHTQGTYTMADAESLLYMTTGILRSLPQLWEEYPSAPNAPTVTP